MHDLTLRRFINHIRSGDRDAVHRMLLVDPSLVNQRHPQEQFGATPLMHAINHDDRAMVDLLLEHGADIDLRSDWANGPFGVLDSANDAMGAYLLKRGATLTPHAAAKFGMIDDLRRMLDADPALVHARGGDGQLPLHFARTPQIADLLLERGADIDARDIDHHGTAAQWLVTVRPDVARHLVSRGAAIDPVLCVASGDIDRLAQIVGSEPEGVNMRITRERFPGPSPAAGHIYLFTIGEGCTLLHAAVNARIVECVRWLLQHGADPNARGGYDEQTPLHAAAWRDAVDIAPLLLKAGAIIDAPSGPLHRNDPLGWAIVAGSEGMVRFLLQAGAPIKPHHRPDAVEGANGAFRALNNQRPIEAWSNIATLLRDERRM